MRAIILAGGRATRLGPLTAQMNKALVSIGQRPMIVHQLELLRRAGVNEAVVVVSPSARLQVADVLDRSMAGLTNITVSCVVQDGPNGPAEAVRIGVDALNSAGWSSGPVFVLMADTFIDEPLTPGDWVGVAPAPAERSWCYVEGIDGFAEGVVPVGTDVAIGVYAFTSQQDLYHAADHACRLHRGEEAPMAPLLNEYWWRNRNLAKREFKTWLDVGDVPALAAAKRKRFITRDFNHLELTDDGRILKRGEGSEFEREARWYKKLDETDTSAHLLFPRLTDYAEKPWFANLDDPTDDNWSRRHPTLLGLEYIDLPSLAELYLYWPGRPDMWSAVISGIVTQLSNRLWRTPDFNTDAKHEAYLERCVKWAIKMYRNKPQDRLLQAGYTADSEPAIAAMRASLALCDIDPVPTLVTGHGDLNFGNILYSLSTMTFKLVDPRGDDYVDLLYEIAKLRYCYRDHFSTITHGLFEATADDVVFGPQREETAAAIDETLTRDFKIDLDAVSLVEATIFFSAVPLHPEAQRPALIHQGMKLVEEVLGARRTVLS